MEKWLLEQNLNSTCITVTVNRPVNSNINMHILMAHIMDQYRSEDDFLKNFIAAVMIG